MILTLMFGLIVCAPRIVELIPDTTRGSGTSRYSRARRISTSWRQSGLDGATLIEARGIGRHVLVALVAGVVLEEEVRIFFATLIVGSM